MCVTQYVSLKEWTVSCDAVNDNHAVVFGDTFIYLLLIVIYKNFIRIHLWFYAIWIYCWPISSYIIQRLGTYLEKYLVQILLKF